MYSEPKNLSTALTIKDGAIHSLNTVFTKNCINCEGTGPLFDIKFKHIIESFEDGEFKSENTKLDPNT